MNQVDVRKKLQLVEKKHPITGILPLYGVACTSKNLGYTKLGIKHQISRVWVVVQLHPGVGNILKAMH